MTTAILAVILAGLFVAFWKMIQPGRLLVFGRSQPWEYRTIKAAIEKRKRRCLRRILEDNPPLIKGRRYVDA